MRVDDKIIFMDGMFPSVMFPVGPPEEGGTCAFMTEHCQQYCPMKTTNIHEKRALKFFFENTANVITDKILDELTKESIMHLYWWSWGDCLPEITWKIIDVMYLLHAAGILQNGYTRNFELFHKLNLGNNRHRLVIGYHAETHKEAVKLSKEYFPKVVCFPEVEIGKGVVYYNGAKVAKCCGIWCEWIEKSEIRIADCQECFLYQQGCFYGQIR